MELSICNTNRDFLKNILFVEKRKNYVNIFKFPKSFDCPKKKPKAFYELDQIKYTLTCNQSTFCQFEQMVHHHMVLMVYVSIMPAL